MRHGDALHNSELMFVPLQFLYQLYDFFLPLLFVISFRASAIFEIGTFVTAARKDRLLSLLRLPALNTLSNSFQFTTTIIVTKNLHRKKDSKQ